MHAKARPPACSISATTSAALASCTSATHTAAPSRARRSAVARPMPDAPPVTTAALPAKRALSTETSLAATFPSDRLLQLGAALVEDAARDDQLLDLLRALEDVQDLRVTAPFLQQLGLAVAQAAAQLDAAQR